MCNSFGQPRCSKRTWILLDIDSDWCSGSWTRHKEAFLTKRQWIILIRHVMKTNRLCKELLCRHPRPNRTTTWPDQHNHWSEFSPINLHLPVCVCSVHLFIPNNTAKDHYKNYYSVILSLFNKLIRFLYKISHLIHSRKP